MHARRGGGVHTVPNPQGRGWANEVCGTLISCNQRKDVAVR